MTSSPGTTAGAILCYRLSSRLRAILMATSIAAGLLVGAGVTQAAPDAELQALSDKVDALYKAKRHEQGLETARKAVAIAEHRLPPDDPQLLDALKELGLYLIALNRLTEAEPVLRRRFDRLVKRFGLADETVKIAQANLALVLQRLGRKKDADALLAMGGPAAKSAVTDPSRADISKRSAEPKTQPGASQNAGPAVAHKDTTNQPRQETVPASMERIKLQGDIALLVLKHRHAEALPLAQRVVELTQQTPGSHQIEMAEALEELASLHATLWHHDEVPPLLLAANRIRLANGQALTSTIIRANYLAMTIAFEATGQRAKAAAHYRLGKDVNVLPIDVANKLNVLSVEREEQGLFEEAERLAKRVLELRIDNLPSDHSQIADSLTNLGMIYWAQGRRAESESLLKRALDIKERKLPDDKLGFARVLANLASLTDDPARFADVEKMHQRVIELTAVKSSSDNWMEDITRQVFTLNASGNFASFYRDHGKLDEASALQERMMASLDRDSAALNSFFGANDYRAKTLSRGASIRVLQGRTDDARTMYAEALALETGRVGEKHPDTLMIVGRLAALDASTGNWSAAYEKYVKAADAHEANLAKSDVAGRVYGRSRSGVSTDSPRAIFLAAASAALMQSELEPDRRETYKDKAFGYAQLAERSTAGAAIALMGGRLAKGQNAQATELRNHQDLAEQVRRIDAEMTKRMTSDDKASAVALKDLREQNAAIQLRMKTIETRLGPEFKKYLELIHAHRLSLASVHSALREDEVLVSFQPAPGTAVRAIQKAPEATIVWVVTKTDVRWVRSDLGADALSRDVAALRCGLDSSAWVGAGEANCQKLLGIESKRTDFSGKEPKPLPFDRNRAHKLFKALFGEVEDLIKGKHLLLVPSGPLTALPFQVLLTRPPATNANDRDLAWLINDHALTVLPAVSSLKALREPEHANAEQDTEAFHWIWGSRAPATKTGFRDLCRCENAGRIRGAAECHRQ